MSERLFDDDSAPASKGSTVALFQQTDFGKLFGDGDEEIRTDGVVEEPPDADSAL